MRFWVFSFVSWIVLTVIRLLGHYSWVSVIGPEWPRGYWYRIFPQIIVIAVFSYVLIRIYHAEQPRYWLKVGACWLALTLMFEFGGGHYFAGESFELLFEGWKLWKGNIWVLVLFSHLLFPYMIRSITRGSKT